jgi:hypothetical protein
MAQAPLLGSDQPVVMNPVVEWLDVAEQQDWTAAARIADLM